MEEPGARVVIALVAMTVLSFTNLLDFSLAGAAVILGIIMFFVNKALEHDASSHSGLDLRAAGTSLRDKSIWLWIAAPVIANAISIALARALLPAYVDHVIARTQVLVSIGKPALLLAQLAVLALGEEIAWRAFFQAQSQKVFPTAPAVVMSSVLFAIGHVGPGNFVIVGYDVLFVFVNGLLYGITFAKTKNAWICALSHFIANLAGVMILVRMNT